MADDIDDLLDEVESKFCVKKNQETRTLAVPKQQKQRSKLDEDVNDILELDIPSLDNKANYREKYREKQQSVSNSSAISSSKKCFPVYVGGSVNEKGFGSSVNQRICNSLRCTSCDFKVSIFPDYEWYSKTDYLFLRNNAPDFQKLKSNLKKMKGINAYNCQCSWRNFQDLTELKDPKLKWVCGKHS